MACCEPGQTDDTEEVGFCEECEGPINKNGETIDPICGWSPIACNTCGDQPCDLSC